MLVLPTCAEITDPFSNIMGSSRGHQGKLSLSQTLEICDEVGSVLTMKSGDVEYLKKIVCNEYDTCSETDLYISVVRIINLAHGHGWNDDLGAMLEYFGREQGHRILGNLLAGHKQRAQCLLGEQASVNYLSSTNLYRQLAAYIILNHRSIFSPPPLNWS
jgi:hypothetical protein